jgi:hypothetical protein
MKHLKKRWILLIILIVIEMIQDDGISLKIQTKE